MKIIAVDYFRKLVKFYLLFTFLTLMRSSETVFLKIKNKIKITNLNFLKIKLKKIKFSSQISL